MNNVASGHQPPLTPPKHMYSHPQTVHLLGTVPTQNPTQILTIITVEEELTWFICQTGASDSKNRDDFICAGYYSGKIQISFRTVTHSLDVYYIDSVFDRRDVTLAQES